MYRFTITGLLFFLCTLAGFSQSVRELMAEGDKYYGKKQYKKAIDVYLQALNINPDDATLNLQTGLSYLYSETKSKAARYISKAYRLNPSINDQIDYHLGVAFQNTNEFTKAIEHFQEFRKKKSNLASIADKKIAECRIADSLSNYELNVIIENAGTSVNTYFHDYAPIISGDGNTLIFTSNRTEDEKEIREETYYEDIYITRRTDKGWAAPKKISARLNHKYNDAAASLSPDGKTLAFLSNRAGYGSVFLTDTAGETQINLTPKPATVVGNTWSSRAPDWSRNGQYIYFTGVRPQTCNSLGLMCREQIFVMNSDGTGVTQLTSEGTNAVASVR